MRKAGKNLKSYHQSLPKPQKMEIMELDEMYFIKKKTKITDMVFTGKDLAFRISNVENVIQEQQNDFGKE